MRNKMDTNKREMTKLENEERRRKTNEGIEAWKKEYLYKEDIEMVD